LKPGRRFVAELGAHGNVKLIRDALQESLNKAGMSGYSEPWYFPTIGQYAGQIEAAGLSLRSMTLFSRPTPLSGEDAMASWLTMFAADILATAPEQCRATIIEETVKLLRPTSWRDGQWWADYWRLRFMAVR
jgi:hypothetical protein